MLKSLCAIVVLALCGVTQAIHFYTTPGTTRCFYEELTKSSLVIANVDAYASTSGRQGKFVKVPDVSLELSVYETFDNEHLVMKQKSNAYGEFAFSAVESGEHRFCITPTFKDKKSTLRVLFDIVQAGDEMIDSQKRDTISLMKNKVKEMNNKLQEIKREQELIREREAIFRDLSETTNGKVVKFCIVQLVVLAAVCWMQLKYLKSFFIKHKVV